MSRFAQGYFHRWHDELHGRVLPFWLKHGPDREHGGIYNVLDEAGQVISGEKYMWSQTRALWVFAEMALREGSEQYAHLADSLLDFCLAHGRDQEGGWVTRVSREGKHLQGADSIYTSGFAMMGLGAFLRWQPGHEAAREALDATAEFVGCKLPAEGSYGIFPYQIPPGMRVQGIHMLFSLAYHEAWRATGNSAYRTRSIELADDILGSFYDPAWDAIIEYLPLRGGRAEAPLGTTCLPGHAFESLWALLHIYGDKAPVAEIARLLRRHLEIGWDPEFGGIFLAVGLDGKPPHWKFADYKPWWPAVEAAYALAFCYQLTGEAWCTDWLDRVWDWAVAHYPVPSGEWRNRLDRQGRPVDDVIALPVKDPFHLPRALILGLDALQSTFITAPALS